MIKQIPIGLIAIMLCAMPIMADAPHDCDVNNNGRLDEDDVNIVISNYGSYEYWHYYDFNRDFQVSKYDAFIVVNTAMKSEGIAWLPPDPYISTVYIDNYSVYKLDQDMLMDWIENWNQIDKHKFRCGTDDYVCYHYTEDTLTSFESDYGYYGIKHCTNHRGHSYIAAFIGDDLLNRDDWIFVEPQTDVIITFPVAWYKHGGTWHVGVDDLGGTAWNHWIYFTENSTTALYDYRWWEYEL